MVEMVSGNGRRKSGRDGERRREKEERKRWVEEKGEGRGGQKKREGGRKNGRDGEMRRKKEERGQKRGEGRRKNERW